MKISFHWLNSLLPVDLSPENAAAVLTATGLEVEGVESVESVPGGLNGLVVGKITACTQHPNADRLQVCRVDAGKEEPLSIVCGAQNARAGLTVVVATVGTQLHPNEGDPFVIKKGKIRGEVSMGMLCAEDEIGVGTSHAGIIELDDHWQPGTPIAEVYNLESDSVLEIGLTPNRTDGMSHWGVARDLRAGLLHETVAGISAQAGDLVVPEKSTLPNAGKRFDIQIKTESACPSYHGLLIEGIQIGPSPEWAQRRLRAIGINPQNNIVDATNFVLHELGQPLHAFDADAIAGNTIVVRHPRNGETLVTLDGEKRDLHPEDQVIADAEKAMCLAGVFGGADSGVQSTTTRVVLESAYFDPVVTRKMAKRHGLSTDASFRFERGVDPESVVLALERAAHLICEWSGGALVEWNNATSGSLPEGQKVSLPKALLSALVGMTIPESVVLQILKNLDIEVTNSEGLTWELNVPAYRRDVTRPADVVEEILRIYGFDKVPMPERVHSTAAHQTTVPEERVRLQIAQNLVARGFQEMMNNSMTRATYTDDLGESGQDGWELHRRIELMNPLSSDLGVMRQSLLFQGLEAVVRNTNHQHPDLRLFELGRVYQHRENADAAGDNAAKRYAEDERLSMVLTGLDVPENWNSAGAKTDPYSIKAEAYAVLASLGMRRADVREQPIQSSLFIEGVEFSCQGQIVGRIGKVRASVAKRLGVKRDVYWGDFSIATLTKISNRIRLKVEELAKFPAVRRDLSLILDKSVTFGQIRDAASKAEKKLLKRIGLFDVYEGDKLEANQVSYAVSLILQDSEKTLDDRRIEQSVDRILKAIIEETGATLRD
jgi:phenylalanyl-tRNA synthetase beta chain